MRDRQQVGDLLSHSGSALRGTKKPASRYMGVCRKFDIAFDWRVRTNSPAERQSDAQAARVHREQAHRRGERMVG